MINELLTYAKSIGASNDVSWWVSNVAVKQLKENKATVSEVEHIVDFFVSKAAPKRLQKMSFKDAKRKSNEWLAASQKKGKNLVDSPDDMTTIHDFMDGTTIVQLKTKKALEREGFLMGHCVGGYTITEDRHIYSYRDAKNLPHATFEVQKAAGEIVQIKGKGNGEIHPKYIKPILAFLTTIGLNIRPSDMSNLGYYHIPKDNLSYVENFKGFEDQTVVLYGETYAF
jgi:PcfJ-like protein